MNVVKIKLTRNLHALDDLEVPLGLDDEQSIYYCLQWQNYGTNIIFQLWIPYTMSINEVIHVDNIWLLFRDRRNEDTRDMIEQ
jgi:TRAP-type mannitol/chloroaromatic compound transport system permease small subunit